MQLLITGDICRFMSIKLNENEKAKIVGLVFHD